jgi:hypothetical protein
MFLEQLHTGGILHDLDISVSKELATWGDDQIHTWHAIDEDPKEEFDVPLLQRPTGHGSEPPRYVVDEVSSTQVSVFQTSVCTSPPRMCAAISLPLCGQSRILQKVWPEVPGAEFDTDGQRPLLCYHTNRFSVPTSPE